QEAQTVLAFHSKAVFTEVADGFLKDADVTTLRHSDRDFFKSVGQNCAKTVEAAQFDHAICASTAFVFATHFYCWISADNGLNGVTGGKKAVRLPPHQRRD